MAKYHLAALSSKALRSRSRVLAVVVMLALLLQGVMPLLQSDAATGSSVTRQTSLAIVVVPTNLPADNSSYPSVVVSLLDGAGAPTVAVNDTVVYLSTSEQAVGQVTPQVEISVGHAYAIANFTTTKTPGQTTITATAIGLESASVSLTTMTADGYPTHLVITAIPSAVPANAVGAGSSTGNLLLELVDDVGLPAKAVADTTISLYSSNTKVVNVSSSTVTMKQGQFIQVVNYTSGFVPGNVAITASASEFQSGQATVTVLGFPPLAVKLIAQPSQMVTCAPGVTSCTGRLVVALTDLNGNPTRALHDTVVQLRSSDLGVVTSLGDVTIKAGAISEIANYTVTSTPGTAEITASAPNLESGFAKIITSLPWATSPSVCIQAGTVKTNSTKPPANSTSASNSQTGCSLVLYAGPNPVLADDNSYSSVVVSLWYNPPSQSGGNGAPNLPAGPAINATGVTQVTLTSSVTGVGNFTKITFDIPEGQNWAAVTFTSTFQVGTTQLTASAGNLLPMQSALATYGPVPAKIVVTPLSNILPADGQSHPALELALENSLGAPAVAASDISVGLTSSQTGVVQVAPAVIPAGETVAIVNVTTGLLQGSANVTAFESAFTSGTTTSSAILSTVIPPPSALGVYPVSQELVSVPGTTAPPIALQLQDSGGNPARARSDTNLTITSSNSTVLPEVLSVTIPQGRDYALLTVPAAVPGKTTLTIFASGLQVSKLALTFLPFPGTETMTGGPSKITLNQTAVIDVKVALAGVPLSNASVMWTASGGGLIKVTPASNATTAAHTATTSAAKTSNSSSQAAAAQASPEANLNDTTNAAGDSTMIFKPSATGEAVVSARVEQNALPPKNLTFTIVVEASATAVAAQHHQTVTQQLTSFPLLLAPVGGAVVGVSVIVILLRRRGAGGSGEEDFGEEMSS